MKIRHCPREADSTYISNERNIYKLLYKTGWDKQNVTSIWCDKLHLDSSLKGWVNIEIWREMEKRIEGEEKHEQRIGGLTRFEKILVWLKHSVWKGIQGDEIK